MSMPVGGAADEQGIFTPQRFHGQVVIVTGAAQGIGFAVAQRIAQEDGTVVLVDRAELVHEKAQELSDAGAGDIYSTTADLETFAGAQSAVDFALDKAGRVDVLINNVGGTIWAKPYEHYTPEEIEKEINRSLFPTLWMCRAVLPAFIGDSSSEAALSGFFQRRIPRWCDCECVIDSNRRYQSCALCRGQRRCQCDCLRAIARSSTPQCTCSSYSAGRHLGASARSTAWTIAG